jgi:hypothetical protein
MALMSDDAGHLARPKTSPVFWLLLGLVALALAGLLNPLGSHPIIDKVRRIDLETSQIRTALQTYEAAFGAFPSGDSLAVFRALRGDNPQKIVFLQCGAESVSPDGGMLDPWGTSYRIYFSGKEPLIRSAGPNKRFDDSGQKEFDDYIR